MHIIPKHNVHIPITLHSPAANEMAKVVRSEGDRPSGVVEKMWAWRRMLRESGSVLVSRKEAPNDDDGEPYDYGLFDRGDTWRRHRAFLQTGMLDPNAARGFVPGIVGAAEAASAVAPAHAENVNEFLNYTAFGELRSTQSSSCLQFSHQEMIASLTQCALFVPITDMFCSFMFGAQMRTTSTVVSTDPAVRAGNAENERFVSAALGVFDKSNQMNALPFQFLAAKFLP